MVSLTDHLKWPKTDAVGAVSITNMVLKKDLTVCWEWTVSALENEHHIIKHTHGLSASGLFDENLRPPRWLCVANSHDNDSNLC